MRKPSQVLERLLAALNEAGYQASFEVVGRAYDLTVREDGGKEPPQRFRARIFTLEEADREAETGTAETWLDWSVEVPPESLGEEVRPLALSYAPARDLFVGWPLYDALEGWKRRRFPVPYRALREAEESGWSTPLTSSAAYAFRPARMRQFLELHRQTWLERESLRRRASMRRRARKTRAAGGFTPSEILYGDRTRFEGLGIGYGLPPEAAEVEVQPEPKVVETGMSRSESPGELLSGRLPLEPGREFLFQFGIGAEMGATIDAAELTLPEGIGEGSRLIVVLFPFEGEMKLVGATRGVLELLGDGSASVVEPAERDIEGTLSRRILFFRVAAPRKEGDMRLRCNLYLGSTLLQSRLVSCRVGGDPHPDRPALVTELDYALASVLEREALTRVPRHDLSLLVNGGGLESSPTHEFHFFGGEGRDFEETGSLPAGEIKAAIETARGRLREASWSTAAEWNERDGGTYRYEKSPADPAVFAEDLIKLARGGASLFTNIAGALATGIGGQKALKKAVLKPGRIQIASKDGGMYLPAGLFYDHPIEITPGKDALAAMRVCEAFLDAADDPTPLEDSACMGGECPNYDDPLIVCPGGFWGFRHEIGWPVGSDAPIREVEVAGSRPEIAVGVSTASTLRMRTEHVARVCALASSVLAETREEFGELATSMAFHLIYFYCHGGYDGGEPFLELGPAESSGLNRGYLQQKDIKWGDPPPRPLVFINGCRTTKLDPESLGGLVDGFVRDANAIGVVGTEITIFESLACRFGIVALERFLDGSMTIGAAIRRARLELLRERNPLGLVYVPFVAADTRLMLTLEE